MLETYFSSVSGYVQQALDPILLRFVPDYKVQPGFPQFRRSCEVRPPDWESKNEVEMALTPRIQEVRPEKMTKTNDKNKIPHWPEPDGHQYDASMESGIWFATAEKESDISEERPLCRRNAKKYVRREKE
uniref:CAP10 domain-containing protein n=1 Tax=Bursaphelenchus xylophilus TaxID=6326 RepID=A0A1I7S5B7_BURXY